MSEIKREITKEEYDRLMSLTDAERKAEIEATVPISWWCGYGYYGFRLTHYTNEDKYYIIHTIGSSCD